MSASSTSKSNVVVVSGDDVPLGCYDSTADTLAAIKKFPPFMNWIGSFQASKEFVCLGVDIQNIDWIGKRIDGIKARMRIRSRSGQVTEQSIYLSSNPSTIACVLPVITLEEQYVLLCQSLSLANLAVGTYSPLYGAFDSNGELQLKDKEALAEAGLTIGKQSLVPLITADRAYHCSTDGSNENIKFYLWNGTARNINVKRFPVSTPLATYSLMRLSDVELTLFGPSTQKGGVNIRDTNLVLALLLLKRLMNKEQSEQSSA